MTLLVRGVLDTDSMTRGEWAALVAHAPVPMPPAPARLAPTGSRPTDGRREWVTAGACWGLDPNLFFPDPGAAEDLAEALAVCAGCPVRAECLAYALDKPERWGIWGGTTRGQRRMMRRQRAAEARVAQRRVTGDLAVGS